MLTLVIFVIRPSVTSCRYYQILEKILILALFIPPTYKSRRETTKLHLLENEATFGTFCEKEEAPIETVRQIRPLVRLESVFVHVQHNLDILRGMKDIGAMIEHIQQAAQLRIEVLVRM